MLIKNKKKYVSMDFGNKTIKFAVGYFNNFDLIIEKLFVTVLDDGVYDNGKILDKDFIVKAINTALKENKVKVKNAICIIESSEIVRREMSIPKVEDDDVDDIVSSEISHTLSIDLEKYTVQSKVISDINDGENDKLKLSVAVLSNEIIDAHREVLKEAKLKPLILDLSSSTMENLLKHIIEKNLDSSDYKKSEIIDNSIAMVEIGYSSANINVLKNGKLVFNRIVKIRNISDDGELLDLTTHKSIDDIKDMETFNEINSVITEIDMVFKYYTSGGMDKKIDEIFIFGGIGNTEGLDKYMEDIINITTNRIDSINTIIDNKKFHGTNISLFLNAIGGIIRW